MPCMNTAPASAPLSALPLDSLDPLSATRCWLEQAVIGLNLCPFARAVTVREQIRFVVSGAADTDALLDELVRELQFLRDTPAQTTDTTLLIVPQMLAAFDDFVDFIDLAEVSLRLYGYVGEIQLAHFHPAYVFADADEAGDAGDDLANHTNRSPWPTLHLLREASLARATASIPDAASIYERNIAVARSLGAAGWAALATQWTAAGAPHTKEDDDERV
jgi:uncharacterized protein